MLLALGVGLGLAYFVYSAFYPTDGICMDRYERYSSLKFPRSGKILEKEASMINDIKGSFTDCYLVRMSPKDYNQSLDKLRASGKFAYNDSFLVYTPQYKKVESRAGGTFAYMFSDGSKAYTFLGFLNDGKTILINIVGRRSELHKLPPVSNHRVTPQGI